MPDHPAGPTDRNAPSFAPTSAPGRAMRVRIDAGRHGAGTVRGSLLGAFGVRSGAASTAVPERRGEDRHQVECLAWVGWRTWRGFVMNDALLIDLSRGGTRAFLDKAPPKGRAVWLFFETPGKKAVVKARTLDVTAAASGQFSARIAFDAPCPFALFEAAVCGLAPADPKARLAPAAMAFTHAPGPARRARVRQG